MGPEGCDNDYYYYYYYYYSYYYYLQSQAPPSSPLYYPHCLPYHHYHRTQGSLSTASSHRHGVSLEERKEGRKAYGNGSKKVGPPIVVITHDGERRGAMGGSEGKGKHVIIIIIIIIIMLIKGGEEQCVRGY